MRAAKPRPRDLVAYAVLLGVTLAMGVNRGAIAEPQDRKTPPSMVAIPGGAFTMGSSGEFSRADEQPPHRVRVDSVWMDTTEVTNAAFRRFAEATGYVTNRATASFTPVSTFADLMPDGGRRGA